MSNGQADPSSGSFGPFGVLCPPKPAPRSRTFCRSKQRDETAGMPVQPAGKIQFEQDRPHRGGRQSGDPDQVIQPDRGGTEQRCDLLAFILIGLGNGVLGAAGFVGGAESALAVWASSRKAAAITSGKTVLTPALQIRRYARLFSPWGLIGGSVG